MWFDKSKEEVIKELSVDTINGITSEEAAKRKEKYGANELTEKKGKSKLRLFFEQLNDPLIYILLVAAAISGILGETADAVIIAFVVVLNAVIGMVQESKAEKALEALKKLATPKAIVKRDGELKEIPSEDVVPGDIIVLDAGRYVPCDIRLIETANLKVEESALTGESVPVEKDAELILDSNGTALGDRNR